MSRNLYMNLYVQQIFNQEPFKNDLVIQLTTFVFPMPCRKEKHGIFSQWLHFSWIIDVRHFVGFLFRRYGKKQQFSRQFTFLKVVLESLQGTELVTWHISWTFSSSIRCWPTNHRTGFRILGHVTSSVPFKNSSGFFWGFFCV